MYLIDTNVLSELRRPERAEPSVRAWAAAVPKPGIFLSAVTIFEIERGLLLRERSDAEQAAHLRRWFEAQVLTEFAERILPFDAPVARRCAALHVPDPMPAHDAMIAATALVHGMIVVTRNVADFERTGVKLLNPWEALGSA